MRDRVFHYVPYARALDWLRVGWIVAQPNCSTLQDLYGVTMEWLCDCKMARPK
jgi:hypothetical protein